MDLRLLSVRNPGFPVTLGSLDCIRWMGGIQLKLKNISWDLQTKLQLELALPIPGAHI